MNAFISECMNERKRECRNECMHGRGRAMEPFTTGGANAWINEQCDTVLIEITTVLERDVGVVHVRVFCRQLRNVHVKASTSAR